MVIKKKQNEKAEEIETKPKELEKPQNSYTPVHKVAVRAAQHYFPNLIEINYADDLTKNIFYGALTGSDEQRKVKKWQNF